MEAKSEVVAAAVPLKIYPQYGRDGFFENPTPPWIGQTYNLLWIAGADGFDLTKWKITGALISTAVQIKDANGNPLGVHVNLFPTQFGIVRIYQLGDDGQALGGPYLLFCDQTPLVRGTMRPPVEE